MTHFVYLFFALVFVSAAAFAMVVIPARQRARQAAAARLNANLHAAISGRRGPR